MNINNDQLWVKVIKKVRAWARLNSIWAVHFNSGSCNGCDIEILATLTPKYDVERFGIKLEGSPRHADILIVTGPVTRQARERHHGDDFCNLSPLERHDVFAANKNLTFMGEQHPV